VNSSDWMMPLANRSGEPQRSEEEEEVVVVERGGGRGSERDVHVKCVV
jgi:hypothetical protein